MPRVLPMARIDRIMNKELQLDIAANNYFRLMLDEYTSMFSYPDLTEKGGIELETLLEYGAIRGCAGVAWSEEQQKYVCGKLAWSDVPNDNGIADKCVLQGVSWSEEFATEKVAVFRNYHTQTPETRMSWFAQMFAQIDDSQGCLVDNTKYTPVPVASTDAEKTEYENVLRRKQNGEKITVMLRPASNPLVQSGTGQQQPENARVLNLTDVSMIEKMHFLSEYHSEIKKRFGTLYGMCFKSSSKSAQETVDEVNGMDNFSLIVPYIKKRFLDEFAEQCKRLFGWAGKETVKFTELWQREDESAEEASEPEEESIEENAEAETADEEKGETEIADV